MSKESAIKFLRELRTNEKAKELLRGRERPKDKEDAIKAYAEVAAELGEDISPEDFAQVLEEIEAEIHQKTETVSSDMKELEDDDLQDVAGGFYRIDIDAKKKESTLRALKISSYEKVYNQCRSDYVDTNCWRSDACSVTVHYYYDCSGKYFANGAENDCIVSQF